MKPKDLERDSDGQLAWYAWPGGYPLIYLDGHNNVLCPECATKSLDDVDAFDYEKPAAYDVYYEGPDMYCDNCNKVIESAYGDPNEEDEGEN